MNIPDKISITRMALSLVLLQLGWFQVERVFIAVLALAYLSDAIDGPIARRLGQESVFGSSLDTWADVSIYLSVPLAAWWMWPDLVTRELLYFAFIVASIIFPLLAGLVKFRATTSYHTWLTKATAACTMVSSLILFLGYTPLPFRISAILCLLSGLEEILITLKLNRPESNIPGLWHLNSKRRAGAEDNE